MKKSNINNNRIWESNKISSNLKKILRSQPKSIILWWNKGLKREAIKTPKAKG